MTPTEFELIFVIPEVADPGDPRISQVEEHLDVVVESHSGLTLATVTAEGSDPVTAALNAAEILSSCGLPPARSYPDLVTRQDIADRVEVSRQAVGNWVRGQRLQSDPFPSPVHLVGGGVWLWKDVVDWLRRNNYQIDDLPSPSIDEHARIDNLLLDAHTPVGFSGHVEIASARIRTVYAPSVVDLGRKWAGDSFQTDYALAI
ncbi:helix-turn-helix transcriptional regulator [Rhodococcus sp. C26F]